MKAITITIKVPQSTVTEVEEWLWETNMGLFDKKRSTKELDSLKRAVGFRTRKEFLDIFVCPAIARAVNSDKDASTDPFDILWNISHSREWVRLVAKVKKVLGE